VTLEAFAPAKLTLSLRVLGRRDDGFHDLDAFAVSVDEPHDLLAFANRPDGIELAVSGLDGSVPHDRDNLAVRAAEAVLPPGSGLRIALHKGIPAGAGLGGGSSDAAAVLRAVRDAFGVDPARVVTAAEELGSDVPFCLRGGAARMRGRGEAIEPVELGEIVRFVVVVPSFRLATAEVYRAWDELGGPRSARAVASPPAVGALVPELVNDLEPAAERVEPRLRRFRERLERVSGRDAVLAGSGSAYAVWFDDAVAWRHAAERVELELGVTAHLASTLPAER